MKTLFVLLIWIATGAGAQTVWRCGPDGRSYSDSPCPAGQAVLVDDSRPQASVKAAREVAEREKQLAAEMVRERQDRERENWVQGSGLSGIGPARPVQVKPQRLAKTKHSAKRRELEGVRTWPTTDRVSQRMRG
jgi:hypothetical protein